MTTTSTSTPTEFDGKCAFAISVGAVDSAPEHKPTHTLTRDGRTYGFLGPVPKLLFRIIPGSAARAHRRWDLTR
ncbi:hypothetical protein N802_09485 [Knoellia sinensis KCTC 19936]|uniref:Uncharacterized protein n=1 Tax=Knoellia sinensis KCTC 19936 TaxID=1385520 RepID=A0A0A0J257_9MICO|nr:hypothetical protein [Knoellia sinensis]KGN30232.1 hypothetical protein N802_09485 [Knoellia sinensis KCTC 19936]